MSRVAVAYRDEDFEAKLEEREGILFLHCQVDNFSPSVKKRMDRVFSEIKEACAHFGWDALHAYTPNPKFSKMFEGGFTIETIPYQGEIYEVIRWELD